MNPEYKRLYDAWYEPQAVSATIRFIGNSWRELIEWCYNNPQEFFKSVLEQLKEGPTWACQIIDTVVGEPPVKSMDRWCPLDMWCSLWIYIIEGTIGEKKKLGYIPSYYNEDIKYKIVKDETSSI